MSKHTFPKAFPTQSAPENPAARVAPTNHTAPDTSASGDHPKHMPQHENSKEQTMLHDILISERRKFVSGLNTKDDLFDYLLQYGIMTVETKQRITQNSSNAEVARNLLDYLQTRPEQEMKNFAEALRQSNHADLANLLSRQGEETNAIKECTEALQEHSSGQQCSRREAVRLQNEVAVLGPVEIHIMNSGASLQNELEDILTVACATASSRCKGVIQMKNVQWKGINTETSGSAFEAGQEDKGCPHLLPTSDHLEVWKSKVCSIFQSLISVENPCDLFVFSESKPTDEYLYLHIKPACVPLLLPLPLRHWSCTTVDNMADLSQREVHLSYVCFVLTDKNEIAALHKEVHTQHLKRFQASREVASIPGFSQEEMQKFQRKVLPFGDHVLFSLSEPTDIDGTPRIQCDKGLPVWPENFINDVTLSNRKPRKSSEHLIHSVLEDIRSVPGLSDCMGFVYMSPACADDVRREEGSILDNRTKRNIICDILILTDVVQPLLVTIVVDDTLQAREYSSHTARLVDQSLGVCGESEYYVKPFIITYPTMACQTAKAKTPFYNPHVVNNTKDLKCAIQQFITSTKNSDYPRCYEEMNTQKLRSLMDALVICLASFYPQSYVADLSYVQIMNMMTAEQVRILQIVCGAGPPVLVKGLPGTGKTIIALEYAKWCRIHQGLQKDQILYITFSYQLAERIRSMKFPSNHKKAGEGICDSISICEMLALRSLPQRHLNIKCLIVDDIQNYESIPKTLLPDRTLPQVVQKKERTKKVTEVDTFTQVKPTFSAGTKDVSKNTGQIPSAPQVQPAPGHEPSDTRQEISSDFFQTDITPRHWMDHLQMLIPGFNNITRLILYDPTQRLANISEDKIKSFIERNNAKIFQLKQISRNSAEIARFVHEELTPSADRIGYSISHNFKGEEPDEKIVVSLNDMSNYVENVLMDTCGFKQEEIEILIDESCLEGSTSAVEKQTICETSETCVSENDHWKHVHIANQPDPSVSTKETKWCLLQDLVGTEKPVVIAILHKKAEWRRKVAIASRARARLVWCQVETPVSSEELLAKLAIGRLMQLYTLWVTRSYGIIVFNPWTLWQAYAVPLTKQGISKSYGEVVAHNPPARREYTAMVKHKGQLWFIGGEIVYLDRNDPTGSCIVLDVNAWRWKENEGPPLAQSRSRHTVTALDDCLVVVGGTFLDERFASCEILQEDGVAWQQTVPSLPVAKSDHAACEFDGRIWVTGGWTDTSKKASSSMESWSPGESSWRVEAHIQTARMWHCMAAVGGDIIICGGRDRNQQDVLSVEVYNVQEQVWAYVDSLPEPRVRAAVAVYGDTLYVIGGGSASTLQYVGTCGWEYKSKLPYEAGEVHACLIYLPDPSTQ